MAKLKLIYVCTKCGAEFLTWQGKCTNCGEWNSLVAEQRGGRRKQNTSFAPAATEKLVSVLGAERGRISTGMSEFDRVLGGGIVSGSLILLGGEPGIGKSTLVLQVAANLAQKKKVLYVSGEESASQIKLRAERLTLAVDTLDFLAERNIDIIIATIEKLEPQLVIVDSIQMVYSEDLPTEAGGITQVRFSAQKLLESAKKNDIPILLIGHVTKEGNVAGPRTLEHLVDAVLYLEGERYQTIRILRGAKNRFGTTDEAGVFEMTSEGLIGVSNPSQIFLEEHKAGLPGSCITATIEGMRVFLVEVQALTSPTIFGYPKRTASGVDLRRLELIIAVLGKRGGLRLGNQDIYVSVAGGFKIWEPAIDLAIALSIFSAFSGKSLDPGILAFGEIGLSGEIRRVSQTEKRIREAVNLGFKKIIVPLGGEIKVAKSEIIRVGTIKEAIEKVQRN